MLDMLYGAALRLCRDAADAEDLVAETVARALANLDSLKDPQCLRAWVFRILANTFHSECRRRHRHAEVPFVEVPEEENQGFFWLFDKLHQPFLLWWDEAEQAFLDTLVREDIERALDALPEAFRIVVVLAEVQGFSYQEIAEMLEIPVGTVRSRLSRGRSLLQKALWVHAQAAGWVNTRSTTGEA